MLIERKNNELVLHLSSRTRTPRKILNIFLYDNETGKIINNYINEVKKSNLQSYDLDGYCFLVNKIKLKNNYRKVFTGVQKKANKIIGRNIFIEKDKKYIIDNMLAN